MVPPMANTSAYKIVGQRLHFSNVVGVGDIEKRSDVQLTVADMAVERRGDLVLFERVLHLHQKVGQRRGGHGDIFDESKRAAVSFQPMQRGHHAARELPKPDDFGGVEGLAGIESQLLFAANAIDHLPKLLANGGGIVAGDSTSSSASASGK